ncbi:helix-turn-helix domain-containing protein [Azospirillum argentinense]|uniref:Helix-turn-helix domain-containing protein n=1 Tax=Azospirillum argentinense TaxID=2970906 RepID=A0ABW8VH87_9PROT
MKKKRSISDNEVSLIKAMIARGMKNKDIQFFFNRPDRPVNSGRISQIRIGKYSDCAMLGAANAEELDAFLAGFTPKSVSVSVAVPSEKAPFIDQDLASHAILKTMFAEDEKGIWRFRHGESDRHECKESFGFKHPDKWLRAVAALANNKGGYVVFGVRDKTVVNDKIEEDSYKVIGLDNAEFKNADPVEFTKRLKAAFDPTPLVETVCLNIGEQEIGVMCVYQHAARPIISIRNEGQLVKEGEIYFRYPGQSSRIKYSDLRAILDERDRVAREQIMPMVEKLLSLGPRDAMIADLASGTLADGKQSFVIGEDLLNKIKFIREGEFAEKEGASTLRLVGDVQPIDASGSIIRKGFATPADLIRDFLEENSPYDPKEYIRCAVEVSNGAWLPMHYYAEKAELDRKALAAFIMGTNAPPKRRQLFADRASGKCSAYQKVGGAGTILLKQLMDGVLPNVQTEEDAVAVARAVTALEKEPKSA